MSGPPPTTTSPPSSSTPPPVASTPALASPARADPHPISRSPGGCRSRSFRGGHHRLPLHQFSTARVHVPNHPSVAATCIADATGIGPVPPSRLDSPTQRCCGTMPAYSSVAHAAIAFPYSIIRHGYGGTPVHDAFAANTDCDIRRSHPSEMPVPLPHLHATITIANSIVCPLINDGAEIHDGNVSFTNPVVHRPMPMPQQQHCDDVFYGGVDGIRASMSQVQAAARCHLARRQGQHSIFKRRRPIVSATLQQLAERKAIAWASACKVSVVVRLQVAARGLLQRWLQEVRRQMLEAALVAVDPGT
jgi:hypothetical protein